MNELPNIRLDWNQTTEPAITFVRYNVLRRQLEPDLETTWTRIGRINSREIVMYEDFAAMSGNLYEYVVTVTKSSDDGTELDSAYPAPVQGRLTCRSIFVHEVDYPGYYVELLPQNTSMEWRQDVVFLQPRNRPAPIMHVGNQRYRVASFSMLQEWETNMDRWERLRDLQRRQYTDGAVLCIRGYRFHGFFGQIAALSRDDSAITYTAAVDVQETYHSEVV